MKYSRIIIVLGSIVALGLVGWGRDAYVASKVRMTVHSSRPSVPANGSTVVHFAIHVSQSGRPLAHQLVECIPELGTVRTYLKYTNRLGEVVFNYTPPLDNAASGVENDHIEFLDSSVSRFIEVPVTRFYVMHETMPKAPSASSTGNKYL